MRVLVIIGDCVQVNSSANLCHLAYLQGLVESGYDVTLLSSKRKGYMLDPEMSLPGEIRAFSFSSVTLYEKLASIKRKKNPSSRKENAATASSGTGKRSRWNLKSFVLSLYGLYGIYSKFVFTAGRFKDHVPYDVVISVSTPASSHLLAHKLLSSGNVKSNYWIQIWEDPWSGDVFCVKNKNKVYQEEKRLLAWADRVCYVSPITLTYQKKLFPESAEKMYWVPVPSYYRTEEEDAQPFANNVYGYFGDYRKRARNLEPFYLAAKTAGIIVNICGDSDLKLSSTDKIHVYPRLSLSELKPIEDKTGVLVFLSNCQGGQIPGKIYQYASTNKTILFILDGSEDEKKALREYFEQFRRFVFCDNEVEDIQRAIQFIKTGSSEEILNRPLSEFEPEKIIQKVLREGMTRPNEQI